MSAYINGLDGFLDDIKKLDRFETEFGNEALARVKAYTPYNTGKLQASWQVIVKDGEIEFVNPATDEHGVPYAAYVEYGTVHMRGFFMAHRTIAESSSIARIALQKAGL